jgi:hypothetical protein
VLLRASVSGQTHFGVLAMVAKKLGVPAIELQHGLEYLGPGSISRAHAAEFLALYGPAIRRELEQVGYEPERLVDIGSPRFDIYKGISPQKNGTIVCIGSDITLGGSADAYDCEEYYAAFFRSLPDTAKPVIKLRGSVREAFFREMIARVQGRFAPAIETTRPLREIFKETQMVVSCYSTAVLEGLQCGIPTILFPTSEPDLVVGHYHFDRYVEAGAFTIAKDVGELGAALKVLGTDAAYDARSRQIRSFMAKEFCFDGKASERLAAYIRKLSGVVA